MVIICGTEYDISTTELYLSWKNLTKIPLEVFTLTNLEQLFLKNLLIQDYSGNTGRNKIFN